MVFVMKRQCVFCYVGTEFVRIIYRLTSDFRKDLMKSSAYQQYADWGCQDARIACPGAQTRRKAVCGRYGTEVFGDRRQPDRTGNPYVRKPCSKECRVLHRCYDWADQSMNEWKASEGVYCVLLRKWTQRLASGRPPNRPWRMIVSATKPFARILMKLRTLHENVEQTSFGNLCLRTVTLYVRAQWLSTRASHVSDRFWWNSATGICTQWSLAIPNFVQIGSMKAVLHWGT